MYIESGDTQLPQRGRLLYLGAAWTGAVCFFALPAVVLVLHGKPLLAAMLGYASIAVFTGGIAARFEVVSARHPILQFLANLAVASAVTLVFFLLFLLLYHL